MINRNDLLAGTRPEVGSRVLVTEKESFEGYQIMDYKGVVWGISMRAKDIVQDTAMGCKNVTGGELTSYTELSDEVRQRAWDRMVGSAKRIGANAIINFRFEITPVFAAGGTAEVVAYGNAVVIKPIKNYVPLGGLGNILADFADNFSYSSGQTNSCNQKASDIQVTPFAKIVKDENFLYAICPNCELKYKISRNSEGKISVCGMTDVDSDEKGVQIYCSGCGEKFTIPTKS